MSSTARKWKLSTIKGQFSSKGRRFRLKKIPRPSIILQKHYQHKTSFKDLRKDFGSRSIADQVAEKEKKSELAKYVWKLKKKGLKYKVKWSII